MRNDFFTGYLAHSAKGKEWQNHKYVAKVKLASGKYFYFYTQAAYDGYLKRKAAKEAANGGGDSDKTRTSEQEAKRQAAIERVKNAKGTSSSSKKKSGSSKSSTSSKKSKTGKTSSSKSSTKKEKAEKTAKSSSSKTAKEKTTKEKTTKTTTSSSASESTKVVPTLNTYKYKYGLKDSDIKSHKADDSSDGRISESKVKEIIQDMANEFKDGSSGYLLSSFSNNINYNFKWVKEGGTIKLLDPDTDTEVPIDTALLNTNSVQFFRTDNKKKLF